MVSGKVVNPYPAVDEAPEVVEHRKIIGSYRMAVLDPEIEQVAHNIQIRETAGLSFQKAEKQNFAIVKFRKADAEMSIGNETGFFHCSLGCVNGK